MRGQTLDSELIHLPDLVELQLLWIRASISRYILSHLDVPSCKKLIVRPERSAGQVDPISPIDYNAPNMVQAIASSVRQHNRLRMSFDPEYVSVSSHDVDVSFSGLRLQWWVREPEALLAREVEKVVGLLERACPEARVTELWLAFRALEGFKIDCIWGLRDVEAIQVGPGVGEEVLRYLGRRRADAEGAEEWPCPNLRRIDLRYLGSSRIGDIRKWVSGRWTKCKDAVGSIPEGTVDVVTPRGKTEKWRRVQKAKKQRR